MRTTLKSARGKKPGSELACNSWTLRPNRPPFPLWQQQMSLRSETDLHLRAGFEISDCHQANDGRDAHIHDCWIGSDSLRLRSIPVGGKESERSASGVRIAQAEPAPD